MKSVWICEKCGAEFSNEQECIQHELQCDQEVIHICSKCGKEESWKMNDDEFGFRQEGWHEIYLGRMGYGSGLDGSDVNFELCDKCLCEFINTFEHKNDIYNSGSNFYLEEIDDEYGD
jgi:hypothetical protein